MYDLLICNGTLPLREFCIRLAQGARSITCADGGANKARDCGITPHRIVGDFDSIEPDVAKQYEAGGVEFIRIDEQEHTDFEKSMNILVEDGCRKVVLLGLTGGLLDHTLGNLSILQRFLGKMEIVIYDEHYRIDVITAATTFNTEVGARVSIVPLQLSTGVQYEGLKYHLPADTVENGINEGTCNTATKDSFTVGLQKGAVMVFREKW